MALKGFPMRRVGNEQTSRGAQPNPAAPHTRDGSEHRGPFPTETPSIGNETDFKTDLQSTRTGNCFFNQRAKGRTAKNNDINSHLSNSVLKQAYLFPDISSLRQRDSR